MSDALGESFRQVYERLKLEFYHEVFCLSHDRDAGLSAVEAFSLEVIDQLGRPTIGQFAEFLNISRSNATYKVAGLERLGYVRRERSGPDKREFYLVLTDEYYANAALLDEYVSALVERIRKRFTVQESQPSSCPWTQKAERINPGRLGNRQKRHLFLTGVFFVCRE